MNELFLYFLKLGSTGFGGPIALIGMMETYFVDEKKSISSHDFHQMVGASKLFPGPLATLVAIRIGRKLGGIKGGYLAGFGIIIPSFFMILFFAWGMSHLQNGPPSAVNGLILGLNIGGLALSFLAAIRFVKPLITTQSLFYLIASGVLTFLHPKQEVLFLLSCGILSLILNRFKTTLIAASGVLLIPLFLESIKASLFTFGSGIAIVPVLKAIYIDQYHWVSNSDFLMALSLGQMTPGPLIILNTYLGNQIAQFPGAIVATFGTFIPTFFFGIYLMPFMEVKLLASPVLKAFFAGMLPAVGGAIFGSVVRLSLFAFEDNSGTINGARVFLLALLLGVGLKTRFHPVLLIFMGGMLGALGFLAGIIQ